HIKFSFGEIGSHLHKLFVANGIGLELVKEVKKPGFSFLEAFGRAAKVPHLNGSADKLISSGALHTVNTEICSAYTNGVFRSPGSCRIIFCGYKPVARIDRCCYGSAEVYVTESEHKIFSV